MPKKKDDLEVCVGCGEKAPEHPFVGIGHKNLLKKKIKPIKSIPPEVNQNFRAFPICEKCWKSDEHKNKTLKMSYFSRDDVMVALVLASHSSNAIGGGSIR